MSRYDILQAKTQIKKQRLLQELKRQEELRENKRRGGNTDGLKVAVFTYEQLLRTLDKSQPEFIKLMS